jgi:tetratricopeptide (TPR) repeat protein
MSAVTAEKSATIDAALAHAERLLASDPGLAAEQASEILKVAPGHPVARVILGAARRANGEYAAALALLAPLAREQPHAPAVHVELGLALAGLGRSREALDAFAHASRLKPALADAWRALGDELLAAGDASAASEAYARQIEASVHDPKLMEAARALCDNRLAVAERVLKAHLMTAPSDVAAIRMLGEVAARLGRSDDAVALFARCLELEPGFAAARHNYAIVLHRQNKSEAALAQIDLLVKEEGASPTFLNLRAAILARIGDFDTALPLFETVLKKAPNHAKIWMSYGHALKTANRLQDAIAAYRKSSALAPGFGEVYWSLANLKTFRFSDEEIAAMEAALKRDDLTGEDHYHLHYALGKAYEDRADYARSFAHYDDGARSRRRDFRYNADERTALMRRAKTFFTADLFKARAALGAPAPGPIFVVGMPRAGSTLIEQILSSHSQIEGTMELSDIGDIAREIGGKGRGAQSKYPEALGALSAAELAAFGESYLNRTRIQRRTDAPFFIDKMPNNFQHIGLIHLILPNAKIIDARRHPMANCFAAFKQHFARGQHFSYDLMDLGRYYADYVELTAHFDRVLPGRVHRVIYERMVSDTETEVRRLLEYCALPFEAGCLRFYENERAVRTPSSEQVRQPIFSDAVDHWRCYENWLEPLKSALGPVLESYPETPNYDT